MNKPISSIVDKVIHNKPVINGNNDISRIAFMAIIDHAVKSAHTKENVVKVFSATGVITYNPNKTEKSSKVLQEMINLGPQ